MFVYNAITVTAFVVVTFFLIFYLAKATVNRVACEDNTVPFWYFILGGVIATLMSTGSALWVMDMVQLWPMYGVALFTLYLLAWIKPYQKNLLGSYTIVTYVGVVLTFLLLLTAVHFKGEILFNV